MPATLIDMLSRAALSEDGVAWAAPAGGTHAFRICGAAAAPVAAVDPGPPPTRADDFGPLPSQAASRTVLEAASTGEPVPLTGGGSDRLVGTLVHRLIERHGLDADLSSAASSVVSLLRPDEMIHVVDVPALATTGASHYAAMCARDEVRAACATGERLHEVPFAMRAEGGVLRGTIDCLIRHEDGSLTVLEFKTGRPRPEHRMQLDFYLDAVRGLFPDARVEGLLVYPGGVLTG